jgi:hypothetical protein
MITLKRLVMAAGAIRTRPGPYLESWPKIILFVVVIAVLGELSRFGTALITIPSTAVTHPGMEHRVVPSREERLVQREPTGTTAVVRPRCAVPSGDIALC